MNELEYYKQELLTWLSEQNEYQVYLKTAICMKFMILGCLVGIYYMANKVLLLTGSVPDGLESAVEEAVVVCAIAYTICIAVIVYLESKLS